MSEDYGSSQDPTRLCPTCRMPISVLATRCRHCGETVARPRREEHKLTIRDLGGESSTQYTVSGNVMDALEAFRADELSAQEVAKQEKAKSASWFGKTPTPRPGSRSGSSMPELDAHHLELANVIAPRAQHTSRSMQQQARPAITRTVFTIGAVVAGLVLLYLGTDFTWARISDYLESRGKEDVIDYNSRASEMLAQGAPIDEAFREAVEAVEATDKPENRQELEDVRQELLAKANRVLNAPAYDPKNMSEASAWLSKAAQLDNDPRVQEMWQRVQRDQAAYKMVLINVDVAANEATFRLNNHFYEKDEETVKVGSYVQERFLVTAITERSVRLEDTLVPTLSGKGRTVIAKPRAVLSST